MKTSELMLDFLKKQGFLPEVEEHGISFNYQMKTFIYWIHDDDNEFFQLTLPGIFKANEANLDAVLRATNYLNSHLKVVKANVVNEEIVWLFFEILLDSNPALEEIVPRALNALLGAQNIFYQKISEG